MAGRPHGRSRNVTGTGTVFKRGDGLGTGPVGNSSRPSGGGGRSGGGGGRISPLAIIMIIALVIFGGKFGLGDMLGGGGGSAVPSGAPSGWTYGNNMMSTSGAYANSVENDSKPDKSVAQGARAKYTDTANAKSATVLVYMCGADLESRSGMATRDLQEMAKAQHSDNVKIIVETGGAKQWKTNGISSQHLQRWQVTDKGLVPLQKNAGSSSMTDPSTLKDFLNWGMQNYRSDRMMLIFWDHGGGSVTGYGYDEKFNNGSMALNQIASALGPYRGSFDFIGFDACLMATLETAVAMEPYSDYLIASEETEPGTGWYYTEWLGKLAKDPSISTVDLAQSIIDSYTSHSSGATTLSITDLAEISGTIAQPLRDFSTKLSQDIKSDNAKKVADARAGAKEFARSSKIDQIDLTDFARKLGTDEAKALARTVDSAVKYNRTQNISNSYGLSVYFPYRNNRLVSRMTDINNDIKMDSEYTGAMRSFATLNASAGYVSAAGSNSVFDMLGGAAPSNGTSLDYSSIFNMLSGGGLDLGSALGGQSGVDTGAFDAIAQVLGRDHLSSDALDYTEKDGQKVLSLSEQEWSDIHEIDLNVWIDDGSGYIDLGYDSIYDFNDDGDLIADYDGDWIALNNHPAAVYTTDAEYGDDDSYTIHSYIPAMLNGEQVRILLEYSDKEEDGKILGAEKVYDSGTSGKGLIKIEPDDKIDLVCDYYGYDGSYQDSYYMGDSFKAGDLQLSDVELTNDDYLYGYALKDTWNTVRYTPFISSKDE